MYLFLWKRIYYWISKIFFCSAPRPHSVLTKIYQTVHRFHRCSPWRVHRWFICLPHLNYLRLLFNDQIPTISPCFNVFFFFNAYTLFSLRSNAYYCQRQAIRRYESCIIEMLSDSCEKWRRNIIPSFKRLCIPFGYFNRFSDHPRVTIVEVMLCRGTALPSDVMPCKQIPIFFTLVQATTSYTRQIVCLSMRSCFIQIFTKLMLHYGGLEQWV